MQQELRPLLTMSFHFLCLAGRFLNISLNVLIVAGSLAGLFAIHFDFSFSGLLRSNFLEEMDVFMVEWTFISIDKPHVESERCYLRIEIVSLTFLTPPYSWISTFQLQFLCLFGHLQPAFFHKMKLAIITMTSLFLAIESCFTLCIHKIVVDFELSLVARLKLDELLSIECLVLSAEV